MGMAITLRTSPMLRFCPTYWLTRKTRSENYPDFVFIEFLIDGSFVDIQFTIDNIYFCYELNFRQMFIAKIIDIKLVWMKVGSWGWLYEKPRMVGARFRNFFSSAIQREPSRFKCSSRFSISRPTQCRTASPLPRCFSIITMLQREVRLLSRWFLLFRKSYWMDRCHGTCACGESTGSLSAACPQDFSRQTVPCSPKHNLPHLPNEFFIRCRW